MAKAAAGKGSKQPSRKWPRKADLKPWLECYLDLCEQHSQPDHVGIKACTRLKQLAECGHATAALARLQRLLDRLPAKECQATAFLALTGAGICLEIPDLRRADKYLQLAETRCANAKPADQKSIRSRLKQLLVANGLPESTASGPLEVDSELSQLGQYRQRYRTALAAGDTAAATRALQKAVKRIPEIDEFWEAPGFTLSAITAYRRLEGEAAVIKYLAWLDRSQHAQDLSTGSLWGMGLTEVANQRAEKLVSNLLKKLKHDPDPNIHFPVNEICKELWFFLQTGQKDIAARLLQKVLRAMPHWPGLHGGFAAAGVLTDLAEVLAEIDGPEAACKLLGLAVQAGQKEPHRGFRKGALKAAHQQLEAPGLVAAITKAQAIKNVKQRRAVLIPLLARHAAWTELATALNEITQTDELLEAVDTALYKLPGGDRIA